VVIWIVLGGLGVISPLVQAGYQNFVYDSDPTNPYVYAHTHRDIFTLVENLKSLIRCAPDGQKPVIQVVCPGEDYWPLPWYMRDYDRVGYSSAVDINEPSGDIILFQPAVAADIMRQFDRLTKYELYVGLSAEPMLLRPGVPWVGYVRKSLSDAQRSENNEQ
jgi:predicted membrane-bound mannosyltransferase